MNRKKFFLTAVILAGGLALSSCSLPEESEDEETPNENLFVTDGAKVLDESTVTYYYYDRLPYIEREGYCCIYNALMDYHSYVKMPEGLTENDLSRLFRFVYYDHPEIFWIEDGTFQISEDGIYFACEAAYSDAQIEEIQMACKSYLQGVQETVPVTSSDYDIAIGIYDYIIKDIDYDKVDADQTLVSAVQNHVAVCAGYTRLYQYLLQNYGIESTAITGLANTGEPHMWNTAYLDGGYYYTDITTGEVNTVGDDINYDFFNVTKKDMEVIANFEKGQLLPACTDTKDNYFEKNGINYTSYDKEKLQAQFEKGLPVTIRCSNNSVYALMVQRLVEQKEVFAFLPDEEMLYETNDEVRRLHFYKEE